MKNITEKDSFYNYRYHNNNYSYLPSCYNAYPNNCLDFKTSPFVGNEQNPSIKGNMMYANNLEYRRNPNPVVYQYLPKNETPDSIIKQNHINYFNQGTNLGMNTQIENGFTNILIKPKIEDKISIIQALNPVKLEDCDNHNSNIEQGNSLLCSQNNNDNYKKILSNLTHKNPYIKRGYIDNILNVENYKLENVNYFPKIKKENATLGGDNNILFSSIKKEIDNPCNFNNFTNCTQYIEKKDNGYNSILFSSIKKEVDNPCNFNNFTNCTQCIEKKDNGYNDILFSSTKKEVDNPCNFNNFTNCTQCIEIKDSGYNDILFSSTKKEINNSYNFNNFTNFTQCKEKKDNDEKELNKNKEIKFMEVKNINININNEKKMEKKKEKEKGKKKEKENAHPINKSHEKKYIKKKENNNKLKCDKITVKKELPKKEKVH